MRATATPERPSLDRLAAQGVVLATAVSTCPVCSPYAGQPDHRALSRHPRRVRQRRPARTARPCRWPRPFGRPATTRPTSASGTWTATAGRASSRRSGGRASSSGGDASARTTTTIRCITPTTAGQAVLDRLRRRGANRGSHRLSSAAIGRGRSCWSSPGDRRTIPTTRRPEQFRSLFCAREISVAAQRAAAGRRPRPGATWPATTPTAPRLTSCVGRIAEALESCGLADDTILVFTSDHGDMLGSHGEVRKQRPWDESILVPLRGALAGGPGPRRPQARRPRSATPDIMPTLLGLCGIAIPATRGRRRPLGMAAAAASRMTDRAALDQCVTPFGEWTRAGRPGVSRPAHHPLHLRPLAGRTLAAVRQSAKTRISSGTWSATRTTPRCRPTSTAGCTQELKRRQDEVPARPGVPGEVGLSDRRHGHGAVLSRIPHAPREAGSVIASLLGPLAEREEYVRKCDPS